MFKSIVHLLLNTIKEYPENVALKYKKNGHIESYTYQRFGQLIRQTMHGLLDHGLKAGDRVALLSNNRPEWTITDFAVFSMRGVVVPIYQTLPPNQIEYILKDAETRAIFVENDIQLEKINEIKNIRTIDVITKLMNIYIFDMKAEKTE